MPMPLAIMPAGPSRFGHSVLAVAAAIVANAASRSRSKGLPPVTYWRNHERRARLA